MSDVYYCATHCHAWRTSRGEWPAPCSTDGDHSVIKTDAAELINALITSMSLQAWDRAPEDD